MEHFPRSVETGIQHMSESVYVGLCRIVGTSIQVAIRRETTNIADMAQRQVLDGDDDFLLMISGSKREGLRMKGSDTDLMYWPNNHRVIWEISQCEYYNTATKTLILSDSSECPPGFSLLELLTPRTYQKILSACVRRNGRRYISSSLYRGQTRSSLFPDSTEHGPCDSAKVGGEEYDFAQCFACDFWPPSASSWVDRCQSWPVKEVVNDIVRGGCHFVPIGNPLGLHGHEHEEWRISFSQAEHKLVHTLDHCQFLTYGLLKIFLKEVIDKKSEETSNLLCSYHMKTTVFWMIQQNTMPLLCPQNFLGGFWVCLKVLLKWVYEGVCPNFFIPQNNLFLSKIHGSAQRSLFLQLYDLHEKGLACLLQSPSIRSYITDVLYNPKLSICTDEEIWNSESSPDYDLFCEINDNELLFAENLHRCTKSLQTVEQLIVSPLTKYQVAMLQRLTASLLQITAFTVHNMCTDTGLNKQTYIPDKMSCHMLKLATKFGYISDLLYMAIYYNKTFRYWKALSILENIKVKLVDIYVKPKRHLDPRMHRDVLRKQSWSTKMKQSLHDSINLSSFTCYINELIPEQQSALQTKWKMLAIPVFVMIHFVEFLCYRHTDTTLAQATLEKLQNLVHHDQGLYIDDLDRDISWEILGICQQMSGDLQGALYSYQQSLRQYPMNRIQTATLMRIHEITKNNTFDWQ